MFKTEQHPLNKSELFLVFLSNPSDKNMKFMSEFLILYELRTFLLLTCIRLHEKRALIINIGKRYEKSHL